MQTRHAGVAVAVLAAVAACGNDRAPAPVPRPGAAPPGDAGPPRVLAPASVADGDPLGEASLMADIEWLTAAPRRGRGSASAEAREVAAWIAAELDAAGYAPVTQAIPSAPDQVNVIATWGPRGDGGPTVIVTAHYDHLGVVDGVVHPGADDNASGVAVALAVARDLAARRDVPGRVIFGFLGAEETGLHGARAYVAAPPVPLADTRVVYNLDMVGRRFFEGSIDGDATIGAVGLPDDAALLAFAEAAAGAAGLELVAVSPALIQLVGEDWRSDDWVFRDAGVRAVHFSTGLHPDYHRATDTADRLDRAQLARIARFLRELVARSAAP